jgi:hypothetical protein
LGVAGQQEGSEEGKEEGSEGEDEGSDDEDEEGSEDEEMEEAAAAGGGSRGRTPREREVTDASGRVRRAAVFDEEREQQGNEGVEFESDSEEDDEDADGGKAQLLDAEQVRRPAMPLLSSEPSRTGSILGASRGLTGRRRE